MSSQDWSTLTLNISGLYFSAAARCKGSCFICRVWHVCFHANSHKHHGGCQKCLGRGEWAQSSLRSSLKVALLNPCKQKICRSWMDVKKNPQTNKKKCCYKKRQPRLRLLKRHLRDHRHLSAERVRRFGALNKEPALRRGSTLWCLLCCARNPSEPVCRCCHAVNQGKRTVNCRLWFIRHWPYCTLWLCGLIQASCIFCPIFIG